VSALQHASCSNRCRPGTAQGFDHVCVWLPPGWMSLPTFDFIAEIVRQVGRPSEPICVNRKPPVATAELKSPTTAIALKG